MVQHRNQPLLRPNVPPLGGEGRGVVDPLDAAGGCGECGDESYGGEGGGLGEGYDGGESSFIQSFFDRRIHWLIGDGEEFTAREKNLTEIEACAQTNFEGSELVERRRYVNSEKVKARAPSALLLWTCTLHRQVQRKHTLRVER